MSSPKKEVRLDRHSATGLSGAAKKDGGGGKGTWGRPGDEYKYLGEKAVLDKNDPNYDSADEVDIPKVPRKVWFKEAVQNLLQEYFTSGDSSEAVRSLLELQAPDLSFDFVKRAVIYALERKERERELTSVLLTKLYAEKEVGPAAIAKGFDVILKRIDDLILDTPDSVHVLAIFLARAVVDEVIPPSFLHQKEDEDGVALPSKAYQALDLASGMIKGKHVAQRLAHGWGPGDGKSVKRLKEAVGLILEEFLVSKDVVETDKSIRELNSPYFHFYVVKRGITLAIEKNRPADTEAIHSLFQALSRSGLVSPQQFEKGIKTFTAGLDDLSLDIPDARKLYADFFEKGKSLGYLAS